MDLSLGNIADCPRSSGNGAIYDANGNLTQYTNTLSNMAFTYDGLNRITKVSGLNGLYSSITYAYDPANQRVYSKYGSVETFFFYGADGKKLGVWTIPSLSSTFTLVSLNTWFGGRLLKPQDRLNSIGKYFPYGEDRYSPSPANPPNGQEKFATYTRDAETGLDYAYQRYYTAGLGRFMSPDTLGRSAIPSDPQSWNRYSYVIGDPAGLSDPTGQIAINPCSQYMTGGTSYCAPPSQFQASNPPDPPPSMIGMPQIPGAGGGGGPTPPGPTTDEQKKECDNQVNIVNQSLNGWTDKNGNPVKGLLQRIQDLIVNKYGWADSDPLRLGHVLGAINLINRINNAIKILKDNNCPDPPVLDPTLLDKRNLPAYQEYKNEQNTKYDFWGDFGPGLGLTGGYAAYRLIRIIPSLLPPLWWTLPENVIVP